MVWSWNHTQDAYANSLENLTSLDKADLDIIYAEWQAQKEKGNEQSFNEKKYQQVLKRAKKYAHDVLVDFIWDRMSEQSTCDNGGFNAHCCPYGCHTVSFESTAEKEAEEQEAKDQAEFEAEFEAMCNEDDTD